MHNVIKSYQIPNDSDRNRAISGILSNETDRKAVELWLKQHPVQAAESRVLSDLRNRVALAAPSVWNQMKRVFQWPFHPTGIESKILAGQGDAVLKQFQKDPEELLKQIDLIKTHIELGSLELNSAWLALLLDHADIEVIQDVIKTSKIPDLSSLTRIQSLRLNYLFPRIRERSDPDIQSIQKRVDLSEQERDAAIAFFIERKQIPLKEVAQVLTREELLRLAPYLRYVDLRDFADTKLGQTFLAQNYTKLNELMISNGALLEGITSLPHCLSLVCHHATIETLPALPLCRFLHCSSCQKLTALPALNFCRRLICDDCSLSSLPPLPLCLNLNCSHTSLRELPELPLCESLNCSHSRSLQELPALPQCTDLKCDHLFFLDALPALPLCKTLNCEGCTALKALPELPQCEDINCSVCDSLRALPAKLPLCKNLNFESTQIAVIPSLPKCETLNCSDSSITALPELPLCKKLSCSTTNISSLPQLPLCQDLTCNGTNIREIPPLPVCQKLDCNFCPRLGALPQLPLCEELYCYGSGRLLSIPPLPHCRKLNCSGCPLAMLPEVPWNAEVITADTEDGDTTHKSLNIDLEKFATQPAALLQLLGDELLVNKPFPNIYYFEKGVRNEAIDCGGVRRDFVTKLCLNLFNEKGLKLDENFPSARSDSEEKAFRSLGALLAQCYPESSDFKTGPLFDPAVYRCLLTPNPGSTEWLLTNYLTLVNAPASAKQLVFLNEPEPQLKNEELTQLAYLAKPDTDDLSLFTHEYFSNPKNRAAMSKEVLKNARQDPRLKALAWMAEELVKRVPKPEDPLQDKIEGILNKEALKKKLTWEITDPSFQKTQEYLIHWIDTHEDQLEKFVYAVTGIRTLGANNLKIQILNRAKQYIPVSHTCFFSLELSGNYESQKVFDEKIAYFLDNALAGSGFTSA